MPDVREMAGDIPGRGKLMRLDVYHHFPDLKVVHEVNLPKPILVKIESG